MSTVDAFIGIGSNLDDPRRQVETAIERLSTLPDSEVRAVSSLYRSTPLGGMQQPDYVNAVAHVATALAARPLLAALQSLERSQGRRRNGRRWSPRVIDLDLLLYGDACIDDDDLTVPHPGIAMRNFVLLPMREIAPHVSIPKLGAVARLPVDTEEPGIERLVAEHAG